MNKNGRNEQNPVEPDTTGLLRCLRFLAQEAACLDLPETLCAIEDALETATREGCIATGRRGMVQAQAFLH